MNPAEWLLRTATRTPDAPALFSGQTLRATYADFAHSAATIGAALTQRGIGPGTQVAVFMTNRTEYLEALYGIWFAGAAAVPINAKLHPKETAWIIEHAEASLIFSDDAHSVELSALTTTDIISVDSPAFTTLRQTPPLPEPTPLDGHDLLWLFYTSGTTGKPKGVQITCANMATMNYSYFTDVDEVHVTDAALYAAPMSHGAGIYNFMHVLRGARHICPEGGGFDAGEVLELGKTMGPISMFAAPTMVRRLVDAAKAMGETGQGLRTITYAGGPMYEADILEAVEAMGPRFIQVYGQGECPMGITALARHTVADRSHPRWRDRLNSVGTAQSAVRVRILDETGADCAPGETGEIAVRGATVMAGYWKNPEATAKTIRNGWLWTGDKGRMDADGYVTLQDRSKDLIISGGSNIYPREVEEVLLCHPDVHEVAVVGQVHAEWGEVVVAFVVPMPGAQIEPPDLDRLCLDRIARFKRPKIYQFIEALPKNNYGKVLKTELRQKLKQGRAT
ncbi:MAG: AMP-binding protein [Pseudomonadota bacterium]